MNKILLILSFSINAYVFAMPSKAPLVNVLYNSALFSAVKNGDIVTAKKLLENRANPNVYANGATPLTIASYHGYSQMITLLLHHGAQANLATLCNSEFRLAKFLSTIQDKTTALMLAAYSESLENVDSLLNAEANPNIQDSEGQTALTYAILGDQNWPHTPLSSTRIKILELLLDKGANPDIIDHHGNTPAYYYSCVAGLTLGFNNKYDHDSSVANTDPLYTRMKHT